MEPPPEIHPFQLFSGYVRGSVGRFCPTDDILLAIGTFPNHCFGVCD